MNSDPQDLRTIAVLDQMGAEIVAVLSGALSYADANSSSVGTRGASIYYSLTLSGLRSLRSFLFEKRSSSCRAQRGGLISPRKETASGMDIVRGIFGERYIEAFGDVQPSDPRAQLVLPACLGIAGKRAQSASTLALDQCLAHDSHAGLSALTRVARPRQHPAS